MCNRFILKIYLIIIVCIGLSACGGSNSSGRATPLVKPTSTQLAFYGESAAIQLIQSDSITALVGGSATLTVYIKNTGSYTVSGLNFTLQNKVAGLSVGATTCGTSLAAKAGCLLSLVYSPTTGAVSGSTYLQANFTNNGQALWSGLLLNYTPTTTPTSSLIFCHDAMNCTNLTKISTTSVSTESGLPASYNIYVKNIGTQVATNISYNAVNWPSSLTVNTNDCGAIIQPNTVSACHVIVNYQPSAVESGVVNLVVNYTGGSASSITLNVNYLAYPATPSGKWVYGWPNYIAMGSITDFSSKAPTGAVADTLFTYNGQGDNGSSWPIAYIIETPYKILRIVDPAFTVAKQRNGAPLIPTLVEYVMNFSGGNLANNLSMLANENNQLTNVFFNLMIDTLGLVRYNPVSSGIAGTILLNPDSLGYIQQQGLTQQLMNLNIPNQTALQYASCLTQKSFNINGQCTYSYNKVPVVANGMVLDILDWLKTKEDVYSAAQDWQTCVSQYIFGLCANSYTQYAVPANISNDFLGFIQAQNWIIKQFSQGKIVFGWHENVSALHSGSWWLQTQYSDPNAGVMQIYSAPVIQELNLLKVFNGAYHPDFIYFDRYGSDDFYASYGQFLMGMNAIYNDNSWFNFLIGVKQVSECLGQSVGRAFLPVMLWQMPGGHIVTSSETPPTPLSMATLPDYLFGDSNLQPNLSNMASWINSDIPLLTGDGGSSVYPLCNGASCTALGFFTMNVYNWATSNQMPSLAADNHVFAVLWGASGAPAATGIWPLANGQPNDNGWLAAKISNYYLAPQPLP